MHEAPYYAVLFIFKLLWYYRIHIFFENLCPNVLNT